MKKLLPLFLLIASCTTTQQTPQMACQNYCSVSGSSMLQDKENACICKTDLGVRTAIGACLTRAKDQNKTVQCFKTAKVQCDDKEMKMVDQDSICEFVNILSDKGLLP